MYDAVNAVERTYAAYAYTSNAAANTSQTAAAAQAAYRVLRDLYPAQEPTFAAKLSQSLAAITDGAPKTAGIALGNDCGNAILARRTGDGSVSTLPPYTGGTAPGQWRPTPPASTPGLLPNWGVVTPFALGEGSALRPAPPVLTSNEYAQTFSEVKTWGAKNSTTRTADQTSIAQFWADGGGTATPPGH